MDLKNPIYQPYYDEIEAQRTKLGLIDPSPLLAQMAALALEHEKLRRQSEQRKNPAKMRKAINRMTRISNEYDALSAQLNPHRKVEEEIAIRFQIEGRPVPI